MAFESVGLPQNVHTQLVLVKARSLMSYLCPIVICNFCSFPDAERDVLEEDLKRTRLHAYAPGTHKNHCQQWNSYLAFCLYFDLTPVPATAHVVALYCLFLSRSLTPQSIHNYLSGIKLLHLIAGFDFPFLQSYEVRLPLKGIQRLAKHTLNRAPPITPEILSKLAQWQCICACVIFTLFPLGSRVHLCLQWG